MTLIWNTRRYLLIGLICFFNLFVSQCMSFEFPITQLLTAAVQTVTIHNVDGQPKINPAILNIFVGDTVYWKNNSDQAQSSSNPNWESNKIPPGKVSQPIVFYSTGTSHYTLKSNKKVKGTIIVNPLPTKAPIWQLFSSNMGEDCVMLASVSIAFSEEDMKESCSLFKKHIINQPSMPNIDGHTDNKRKLN